MHKDPLPGVFEFARRPVRYAVSSGLLTGFILSIFIYGGVTLWRADEQKKGAEKSEKSEKSDTTVLEATMNVRRNAAPTPAPTAAVQY